MLDAWTHAQISDPEISRDKAYCNWLGAKITGASVADDVRLQDFQSIHIQRKGGKKGFPIPDALIQGTLSVDDEGAFREQLARGVGRQRAFGFGDSRRPSNLGAAWHRTHRGGHGRRSFLRIDALRHPRFHTSA